MTAAKQQLQDQLREHIAAHGVIAGWRVWELCGRAPGDYGEQTVYSWIMEVLTPCGDGMKPLTMWIEREIAEVGRQ